MVDVAVINTSEELARVLKEVVEDEGWTATCAYCLDFKEGRSDFLAFLTAYDPAVIVWDIALPYEENWAFFQKLRQLPEVSGREIVLTTTNERVLAELAGETGAIEIIGKPFDLQLLATAIGNALRSSRPS
jgi:DNA-binding response OmpR family regulator